MTSGPPRRTEPNSREIAMAAAYRSGALLEEIGSAHGITRERVRQLLTRYFGIRAKDGGQAERARIRATKAAIRADERSMRRWGCTFAQYMELRRMRKPTLRFWQQRKNADTRGIAWELTLWQWWKIWQESGHWEQRGRGQGYVMCRKGDIGPYAVDNVFIERATVNCSEQARNKSGLPMGVRKNKRCRGFSVVRQIQGQKIYLGGFETPEAAHAAYMAIEQLQVAA